MKWFLFLGCLLCLSPIILGQSHKRNSEMEYQVVNKKDTQIQLQLYCGARNYVHFIGFSYITRIWFSNPIVYAEKISDDNIYQININPILYRDTLYGTLVMKLFSYNECVATYALPNPIVPDVEIICYDSLHHIIEFKDGVAKYNGLISFKAMLSAPNYVRIYKRYRGVFNVEIKDSTHAKIVDIYGWYDSGDRTRPIDLQEFSKEHSYVYIWIDEKKMRRLGDEYINEGIDDIKLKKGFSNPLKLNF